MFVKNEKGFTLIEMLIVLFIITILILVTVPNVTKHFQTIDDKGCEAYRSMIQSQVEAYKINNRDYPESIAVLEEGGYLPPPKEGSQAEKCPNGATIEISSDGAVKINYEQSTNVIRETGKKEGEA